MLNLGIVANEVSGDLLGASLLRELKHRVPDLRAEGVAGPRMEEAGCETLVPMERLSVMGLSEVLRHLRELLAIRRRILRHFLTNPPDVFIGVDAPDFNLGVEERLRSAGIRTVHLVSPTVWAWRPKRVEKVRRAVDLLLSIFPFEREFLSARGVPAVYVGHPLADEIPLSVDRQQARDRLGISPAGPLIALLPGSRLGEVHRLAEPFLGADVEFVTPLVNASVRSQFEQALEAHGQRLPVTLVDGRSQDVIAASDLVLTASGTATLETLLLKRPMVVGYRLSPLTYQIVKRLNLIKVPHVAMANLLAGERLAPELIQERCRSDLLGQELLGLLGDPRRVSGIVQRYGEIHLELRRGASARAAEAVLALVGRSGARA